MSKNLCPENNISFDNSQTVRFDTAIPAGTYTVSAIVESTDTDRNTCLLLFYYADSSTLEVYISRSSNGERVSKTFTLAQDATRVRIYASEGYTPSVGDTGTFTKLMIEAGSVMTDYVPYGDEEPDIPDFPVQYTAEMTWFYAAWAGVVYSVPEPTCKHTMLIKKLLDPSYELPFAVTENSSRDERYLWNLINGTTEMLANEPKSDMEKYFHLMLGGTVEETPSNNISELNYWMNRVYQTKYKTGGTV